MADLKLFLLGSPRLERGGELVDIRLRKAVALLAYLAVAQQPQGRDALAELLWPGSRPGRSRASLRRTLYALKETVGEELVTPAADALALNPEADLWLDVAAFRARVATCLPPGEPVAALPAPCQARLNEAATLYRDDFLAGFTLPDSAAWDEWQFFQREGLQRLLARVLAHLSHTSEIQGAWEVGLDHARRWLALDPLNEPAHRQLMRLYARRGQPAAALRQYEACVRVLDEELGAPPAAETTALAEAIRTRQLPPTAVGAPALATPVPAPPPASHLPVPATPFVGRMQELAEILPRLRDPACRLLTLVGPGGIGKTRLALEVARRLDEDATFAQGVFFVPLAAVVSGDDMLPAIAEALRFRSPDPTPLRQQLHKYLHAKHLLLVLDNVEHLLADAQPASIEIVTGLLRAAPHLKLLVTSRQALNLREEWFHAVAGLRVPRAGSLPQSEPVPDDIPASQYDAVQLFVQSARRARPGFSLDDEVAQVVRICQLVEGMPLAIELAAAWLKMLTPAQVVAELTRSLDILTTRLQNVPARHRSMRVVLEQSWSLLTADERTLLKRLSIFRGGIGPEAAREVAQAALVPLAALVDKALLRLDRDGRYQMHELLRQYAATRLAASPDDEAAVRARHSAFFCARAARWLQEIEGAHKRSALAAMDQDFENIQQAWRWAVANAAVELLEQAMRALEHYFYWRGRYREAEEAYRTATEAVQARLAEVPPAERDRYRVTLANLLARRANTSFLFGRFDEAERRFRQSLDLLDALAAEGHDVRLGRAYALMKMGDLPTDLSVAKRRFHESLSLYRELGYDWWCAVLLTHLGYVALAQGAYDEAEHCFDEALALHGALGDRWERGWVLDGASNVALNKQQFEKAERLAEESLSIHREIGVRDRIADNLTTLSWIALARARPARAQALYSEARALWRDLGRASDLTSVTEQAVQPFTPRWFRNVLDQRLAVVGDDHPLVEVSSAQPAPSPGRRAAHEPG